MSMELKIISPTEDGFVKNIDFNHEELKAELERRLQKYQGLVYTEETVSEAKKDRASLNKFKKALNDKRLEIKRLCLAPYEDFESKVKELVGMVEQPVNEIDAQVKGFEEQKREMKRADIEDFWNLQESDVKTLVSLDRVFNPRWLNTTYSMKKVEEEIMEFFSKVESELALIEELETEFEDQVIRIYLQDFNVAKAMAENKALVDQKAKREELKRQREEAEAARKKAAEEEKAAAARQEEEAQQDAPEPTRVAASKVMGHEVQPAPPVLAEQVEQVEQIEQIDFRVWATPEQLGKLKNFLRENGIEYGRVPGQQAA